MKRDILEKGLRAKCRFHKDVLEAMDTFCGFSIPYITPI